MQGAAFMPDVDPSSIKSKMDIEPLTVVRKAGPLEKKDADKRISTRKPWSKVPAEDASSGQLTVGIEPMLRDPAFVKKVGATINSYKYLKGLVGVRSPKATIEKAMDHVQENLLWLHDKFPEGLRDTSSKWYDGARKITEEWADQYGYPREAIAGTMAALSPQMDWFKNVSLAKRVIEVHKNQQDAKVTPEMIRQAEARAETVPQLPS